MPEKLVFESVIEGLFLKGLHGRVPAALKSELKALGINLDGKLPPAVAREAWYAALKATARHVYPQLSTSQAMREIGRAMMAGTEETLFGKAMAPAVRMMGAKRILLRVPKSMKSSTNFANAAVIELPDGRLQLDVDDVADAPELFQGSLERLGAWAGAKSIEVTFENPTPPAARYFISLS